MSRPLLVLVLALVCLGACNQAPPPGGPAEPAEPPVPPPQDVRHVSASLPGWTLTIPAEEPATLIGDGPEGATLFLRYGVTGTAADALKDRVSAVEFQDEPRVLDERSGATLRYARGTIGGVPVHLALFEVPRDTRRSIGFMAVPEQRGDRGRQVLQQDAPKLRGLEEEDRESSGFVDIVVIHMYFRPKAPLPRQDVTLHVVAYNRGDAAGTGTITVFGYKYGSQLTGFEEKRITLEPQKRGTLTWTFKADEGQYQFNGTPRSKTMTTSASVVVKPAAPGDSGPGPSGPLVPGPTGPGQPLGFVAPPSALRVIALSYAVPVTVGTDVILSAVVANDTPADGTKVVVARVDAVGAAMYEWWGTTTVPVPKGEQRVVTYTWRPRSPGTYTFTAGEMKCTIAVR